MMSKEQIEALLQKEGLTLETLPKATRRSYAYEMDDVFYETAYRIGKFECIKLEPLEWPREECCADFVCHQSDVIELLCSALEKAQAERDAAIEDAKVRACIVCKHNDNHAGEEPCKSCKKLRNWEWRGVDPLA